MGEVRDIRSAASRSRRRELLDERTELARAPRSARDARHWVMDRLAESGMCGPANQSAELLTAEVVGQALLRCAERVSVRVCYDGVRGRVEVSDDGPADRPTSVPPPVRAILNAFADSWGEMSGMPGYRTLVWFEVADDG